MTPDQRKLARHALGLDQRSCSYRNYYAAALGTNIEERWDDMVRQGLAERGNDRGRLVGFCLTDAGALAALDVGETLDPEDFPEVATVTQGDR